MFIKSDISCKIGSIRAKNEDHVLLGGKLFRDQTQMLDFEIEENARFAIAVADGMGEPGGGDVASEYAAHSFNDFVAGLPDGLSAKEITEKIKEWTQTTHQNILLQAEQNPEFKGMATTICGMLFYDKIVLTINIGDSRLYRLRNDIIRQISKTSNYSLGIGDSVSVDVINLTELLYDNDIFLICSDGLSDMITDDIIEQILSTEATSEKLIEAAKNAGSKDNISVVLLKIEDTENW